ncbi:MAG: ribonuclease H-like domain-containing protein [Clostridia bacterium]|nr:ribonuclease H-like domain-containing protein [Clostridia bacterium]
MATKILILDIETAPETAYIWKRYKETIGQTQIKEPGYLLCMAWQWLEDGNPIESPVNSISLYGGRNWKRGERTNDWAIIKKAHVLLNEADIVVGHNIRSFDIGTLNARFIYYGLLPPSPYKICDTIEILKKKLRLPSNSLESVSHYLGIEVKEKQPFTLWRDCLNGVPQAWNRMVEYCEHDVFVTSQLYIKLIPWADQHPNMGLYETDGSLVICPKCGSKHLERRGTQRTMVNQYQRYQCKSCGGWSRGRLPLKIDKSHILTHAIVT